MAACFTCAKIIHRVVYPFPDLSTFLSKPVLQLHLADLARTGFVFIRLFYFINFEPFEMQGDYLGLTFTVFHLI